MRTINNYQLPIINYQLSISIVALLALLLVVTPVLAQGPNVSPIEAMLVGNQNYEAGQYSEAIAVYETIIEAGIQDSALFYNLGNAYYKQGDLGRAILNYRRAQHLNPRDSDTAANLAIARLQTLDQLEPDEGLLANFVEIAEAWLTLNEALVLASILWLLIGLFGVIAILFRRLRRVSLWVLGVLGAFLLVGLISMANRYYLEQTSPPAVVVASQVDVTSGPGSGEQYLVEFSLHTGAEVRLLESRPDWQRIALPGGSFQGWVPAEAVESVILE